MRIAELGGMSLPKTAPNDCPQAPGFRASLPTLILHEACQTAGGIAPLAKLLGVSPVLLSRWLEGEAEAPPDIYWACIEIVLLHDSEEELSARRRGSGSLR
jgi:transcriptional regulator with XRE-family HTH domain